MSRKYKIIITSIMVVLCIILFSTNNICNALQKECPYTALFVNDNYFCIQHGGFLSDYCQATENYTESGTKTETFWNDQLDPPREDTREVPTTESKSRTVDVKITGNWNDSGQKTVVGSCRGSDYDKRLAYILDVYHAQGHGPSQSAITEGQKLLWAVWSSNTNSANVNNRAIRYAFSNKFAYDIHKIGFMSIKNNSLINRINMRLASSNSRIG